MFTADRDRRDKLCTPSPDAAIASFAGPQGGVISTKQLHLTGLDGDGILRRVRAGRLHPRARGVYAVGHTALGADGLLFAAVLGIGEGAVVSHRSAAHLWRIAADSSARIDVMTTRRGLKPPRTIRLHLTRHLPPEDVAAIRGIPVTSVARTLVDLAAVIDAHRLQRAVHEAEVLRLLDVAAVAAVLDRSNGRRGTGRLRRMLDVPAVPTQSELEARFLDLCGRHGLPSPTVGARVAGYEVDFLWRPEKLVVETDGRAYHATARGFENDRRRDVQIGKAGFHVARFTWRRVVGEDAAVAEDARELLALRAGLLGVQDRSRMAR